MKTFVNASTRVAKIQLVLQPGAQIAGDEDVAAQLESNQYLKDAEASQAESAAHEADPDEDPATESGAAAGELADPDSQEPADVTDDAESTASDEA